MTGSRQCDRRGAQGWCMWRGHRARRSRSRWDRPSWRAPIRRPNGMPLRGVPHPRLRARHGARQRLAACRHAGLQLRYLRSARVAGHRPAQRAAGDLRGRDIARARLCPSQSEGIEAVTGFFEIGDVEASSSVATQLDLQNYALVGRKAEDAHLSEFESRLSALADAGATFVLTGKAGSIQRIRRTLKALDVPSQRIRTKAYWTPGKTGLDRASRPTRTARLPVPQIRFVSASRLFPLPPAVVLEADRPLRPKFRRSAKRSPSMYSVSPASA